VTTDVALASLEQRLRAVVRDVRRGEPMVRHVQFRIGGPADLLVIPRNLAELQAAVELLFSNGIRPVVLGQGSNVLIGDRGIRGVVVKIGKGIDGVRIDGPKVTAEAGAGLPALALQAARLGLAGLEFAAGIPGSVGGAVVMNAGAHGHAMDEVVRFVSVYTPDGPRRLTHDEMGFGYRTSLLQRQSWVVAMVAMDLRPETPDAVRGRLEAWLAERGATQPLGPPSSGCIFQNPPGDHAGRLIDHAGGKGLAVGGARVSTLHANYIINEGDACAGDVLALAEDVRRRVKDHAGVTLELEVRLLGEF
jgi:UDP-N-acetylmuramate dehydrogenase